MNAMHRLITPLADLPSGHPGRTLLTGRTPFMAARADNRFSYALQVPDAYSDDGAAHPVVVAVHGTGRRPERYLDAFADFANAHSCVVMAPLFPCGIGDPDDVHNYKFMGYDSIRFDLVLLRMLDDVAARWNVDVSRVGMHGFSGGGQFTHRFLYLHPQRLRVASVGAPGRVTLPDPSHGWWRGVGDIEKIFGVPWDPAAVTSVPTQLLIGSQDHGDQDLAVVTDDGHGSTRLERMESLRVALVELGALPALDVVDGVAHDAMAVLPRAQDFLARHLPH